MEWATLRSEHEPLEFEQVPFDHPLYVLYSSGTTGLPKPIVHGHGGILVEHYKALGLHLDIGPDDRFLWFTTTGWMMWNFLISGLLVGATVVLVDGDPAYPGPSAFWELVAETATTWLGTSPGFVSACSRAGIDPRTEVDLAALRAIGVTGAPLPPEGFRWLADHVSDEIPIWSISGGTDVCTTLHRRGPDRAGLGRRAQLPLPGHGGGVVRPGRAAADRRARRAGDHRTDAIDATRVLGRR